MATLALSAVGAAAGSALLPSGFSFLGATLTGAAIGRAVGSIAGAYIDQALFGASGQDVVREGPRLADLNVIASTEGADIPRLYGRARLGGQIIWATNFEEETVTTSAGGGGKGLNVGGGASKTTYRYYANFAVALCEGEITRLGRVWADGDELTLSDYTYRVYNGSETQEPDSLIDAKEGVGNAPAYRGLAYVVFERLPLEDFGNRIPQLNFEVFRAVDSFEKDVRGVTLIPAAGEFAYHPEEVRVDAGGGTTYSENRHSTLGVSDFAVSVDQLEETLPNCGAVSIFSAWFGSDLRCASCEIRPKVDRKDKGTGTTPISWGVAGLTRASADAVSTFDDRPAYGGTPSDNSVVAAIKDLTGRGLEVLFTPFLLMDVPEGNGLPDPYSGATDQPAHPWRGRITCDPAPGVSGSPDKSMAAAAQIDDFYGTVTAADFFIDGETIFYIGPDEWSYSRFILHNAALCAAAGGVEAFVIGSEMRGLTWVRDSASSYPFVAGLVALAAEVKALLPDAKVTYAADWSEYFGHQPADGTGDVFFHLDPLWSDANIDAIAAFGDPWPGGVAFYRSPATSGFTLKALATRRAVIGVTDADFHSGPTSRWGRANTLRVVLSAGALHSAEELLILGGENVCAVQNPDGEWEVLQFCDATLAAPLTYELTGLLRGQAGTEGAMREPVAAGARFVLLDGAVTQIDMTQDETGLAFNWKYGPSVYDIGDSSYQDATHAFAGVGLRPLSPVHITGRQVTEGLEISWIRRTRIGGDSWQQIEVPLAEDAEAYEIEILDGAAVKRTLASNLPAVIYTTAQQTSDWGAPQASYTVRVYQKSASYGRGERREEVVP
ncbi:MAG: glycoside hydrolase TIM-barrel-like domain-containing protein [Rhodomicrobiaceae bacterium]